MSGETNVLELKQITKKFPGVRALDKIDLDIRAGEVHILVGENGAGKSSLVKILSGMYTPDGGEIVFNGQPYLPQTPLDAINAGLRVVYQEFNMLSYLSVAENIYFEKLPQRNGLVNYKKLYQDTEMILAEVGLNVSPRTKVELLGIAQMQLIEIAKAICNESKVLILDEPTATLTSKEINILFQIIRRLKAKGVTIIYISHRLQEIFEIGDRITVLRNGMKVGTVSTKEADIPMIVKMMVGREMGEGYPFKEDIKPTGCIFEVKNLRYKGNPHPIVFSLRKGELLGIAGLVGSGRTETVRAIFGADRKESGQLFLHGKEILINTPKDAVRNGIGLITEDRKSQGLILEMSCAVNISITELAKISKAGLLQFGPEKDMSTKLINDLSIKTPSINQWVQNLSGGNQQKVVLAKWLFRNMEVLIFDEPTRGIDVGAKYEIYMLLWMLASMGKGIIIISSDLPEIMGICHRMLVFSKGRISGELDRREFNQEKILSLAYKEYIKKTEEAINN
jgi:ribose transport system ATP-binding protein